jgi:hypothetical protein
MVHSTVRGLFDEHGHTSSTIVGSYLDVATLVLSLWSSAMEREAIKPNCFHSQKKDQWTQ